MRCVVGMSYEPLLPCQGLGSHMKRHLYHTVLHQDEMPEVEQW